MSVMKAIFTILLWGLITSVQAQTQLDIQGKTSSTDTVAKIKVNYSGPQNVVGLRVYSAPHGSSGAFGTGGDFFGGSVGVRTAGNLSGLIGMSPSIGLQGVQQGSEPIYLILAECGVLGTSPDGFGVQGVSIHNYGVFGSSTDSAGVYGSSQTAAGVKGKSQTGVGLHGVSNGLAILGESNSIGISGISYGSVPINALFGSFGVVGSSADGPGLYGFSMLDDGVVGQTNDPQNDWDFWAVNGRYGGTSSKRWKNNIINIPDPLDKISQLRGVCFDWDEGHGGYHSVGFIAEEVGHIIPEIVAYEDNGVDAKGMDYSKMTPLLVEAVNAIRREYQEKFKKQQSEIDALQQEMAELRTLIKTQVKNASEDI